MEAKLGRPVLEVLAEHADREMRSSRERLDDEVYIPTQGVVADRGKFEVNDNNPAFGMLERDNPHPQSVVRFLCPPKSMLTEEQIREQFDRHDKNNDGKIALDEVKAQCEQDFGLRIETEEQVQKMLGRLDENKDSAIDWEEYRTLQALSLIHI